MDDQELQAIRAARLNQLQQNVAGQSQGQGQGGGEGGEDEGKRAAEEQMRRDLLATVLDPAARERLARIALVSPALSNQVESIILRTAQSGQLKGRVGDAQLIELLEQAEEARSRGSGSKKGAIVYQRRKMDDDDDDFDL